MRTALLSLVLGLSLAAQAQVDYPGKPIRLVVPYAPGGSSDVLARALGPRLSEILGQPIVVDNKPGAGSMLGTDAVAKSAADGYTLLLADMPHTIVPAVYGARVPYDPVKGFDPVSLIGVSPLMLFVHPSFPARTLGEFIAHAKANPAKVTIGSGGNGTATHLMAELLQENAAIKLVHVPYKGAGPAVADTVAGQIQATFTTPATASGHLKAGRLRALGVTADERLPDYPEVPTLAESGVRNMVIQHWWGILAPSGLPRPVIQRLNAAMRDTLASKDVKERFKAVGVADPPRTGPDALRALIAADLARWSAIVASAGIKAD
jgi:tripartite-type tricarboxylate transporter receptor subunit TctC